MKRKQQILHIHGGMAFNSRAEYFKVLRNEIEFHIEEQEKVQKWHYNYLEFLDSNNYQIIKPTMPSKDNASYEAWEIWFSKVIPFLIDDIILVGYSLGGIFLAKYLSESIFPVRIQQLHLVAAVYDFEDEIEQLGDFKLTKFPGKLIEQNIPEIHIYHSRDNIFVPILESEKYHVQIPGSHFHVFEDKGHFLDETFPELFANIKRGESKPNT
jgi:predicted alpha/beta hydrolase family esterase